MLGTSNMGAGSASQQSVVSRFAPIFSSGPLPTRKDAPAHGITPGAQVFHTKFGEGKVLAVEGSGDDARAQVAFGRHGTKWLALAIAKLTVIE